MIPVTPLVQPPTTVAPWRWLGGIFILRGVWGVQVQLDDYSRALSIHGFGWEVFLGWTR